MKGGGWLVLTSVLALATANAQVVFPGPWRGDYAGFAITVDPGQSPGPFSLSYQFGHKSEVFQDFWGDSVAGFAAPGAPVTMAAKFPNIEHAHIGWSLATEHLGAGGTGRRSYTELGAYVPGADGLAVERDLLPRVWSSAVERTEGGAWGVSWSHEPGLPAASDAFVADVYVGGPTGSLSWRLIGRPSEDLGFGLPQVKELAGSEAFSGESYVDLTGVTWIDWATVAGFGVWIEACTGVDLNACVRGLAETMTRTSGLSRGRDQR